MAAHSTPRSLGPRHRACFTALVAFVLGSVPDTSVHAGESPTEISWPRVFEKDGKRLTVHQPQVDSWKDFATLHCRCAVSIEGVLEDERVGVAEVEAKTVVDHSSRLVAITPVKRELRFPSLPEDQMARLRAAVEELNPSSSATIISLDRVLACVEASKQPVQRTVSLCLDPPKIYYSAQPAILVSFNGKPTFKPVSKSSANLRFALNTNWDLIHDTTGKRYYLLDGDGWITASNATQGPWTPTKVLSFEASDLPDDANWSEVRKRIPGSPASVAPSVIFSTDPAELIVTEGLPKLSPIPSTRLSRVTNTESVVFRHSGTNQYYFLTAGRWFAATSLDGPWTAASEGLPEDFAAIPDDDESAFVKAAVPGTQEAQDAVLLASVPNTTVVERSEKPVVVVYDGPAKFLPIEGTEVEYAVNTSFSVFRVENQYYSCDHGVWFVAGNAEGPWSLCTSVPKEIYSIPPSNPHYNVTYVTVQGSTPTTVTYCQTSGYSGEYVAQTGVLMFGAGMLVGAAIAAEDDDDYYYYAPYPCYYSYGCGATYHYGYGGYYAAGYSYYGPYGGAGCAAGYNPSTGSYARSAYAYGPYGSAATTAAYNPYTGARGASTRVHTAAGSAGRAAAYNPTTGTHARAGYASGPYGSVRVAGVANPRTGTSAGVAAWNTAGHQGTAAKTRSGDLYATHGDTVYKREAGGGWSSNSGSGWQSAPEPRATTSSASSRSTEYSRSISAQAEARQRGNQLSQRTTQFRSGGSGRLSGGGSSGFRGLGRRR